jgi:HlyD family secretion protein
MNKTTDNTSLQAHWQLAPGETRVGLQGAALILELQRIQQAFDREFQAGPRPLGRRSAAPAIKRNPPKRFGTAATRNGPVGEAVGARLHRLFFPSRSSFRQAPRKPEARAAPLVAPTTSAPDLSRVHELREDSLARRSSGAIAKPLREAAETLLARRESVHGAYRRCLEALKVIWRFLVVPAPSLAEDLSGTELRQRVRHAFEHELRTGLRVLLLGIFLVGGWASLVPLSGAVVVGGTLVAQSNVKKVQHPAGGIVLQILAHDGMRVEEGDLLVRLDETQARTNLQVLTKHLDEIRVRIARLIAERDGQEEPKMPRELITRLADKDIEQLFLSEKTLFKARANARQSQKELLRSRIAQLGEEIIGLNAQVKSKAAQLELISGELQGVQNLYDKRLVPLARVTALQREAARLDGERGQVTSGIAETHSKMSEAELQIIRIDQDFRTEVMKDLRESQDKAAEIAERSIAAQDQLNRIEIRSPTAGVVHQLAVHTIGGVIAAGEVIMEIVPDADELQIEARLASNDIDQVHPGQNTHIRLSAFNQRTTPQLNGVVTYVSADLSRDRQTNAAYYTVRVTLPGDEVRRLGSLQLIAGMPAEVFLQTASRTMMSYLFKPITDQLQRTFNER